MKIKAFSTLGEISHFAISEELLTSSLDEYEIPLKIRNSDTLDGSGCHRV